MLHEGTLACFHAEVLFAQQLMQEPVHMSWLSACS